MLQYSQIVWPVIVAISFKRMPDTAFHALDFTPDTEAAADMSFFFLQQKSLAMTERQ